MSPPSRVLPPSLCHTSTVNSSTIIANGLKLARVVRETIDACWRVWQHRVPRLIRWAVYGALLGLGVYLILGFFPAGVAGGLLAASIQSGIGNVAAGSAFAIMQSLGAQGILAWLLPLAGAATGAGVAALVDAIRNLLRQRVKDE